MSERDKSDRDKNEITIEPGTLLAIVAALLLIPLLVTGFFSH